MSSRGGRKVKTHRMDGAIAALTPLGFSKKLIRDTINNLKKVYGDDDSGWYFVEENYYKLVIDKIIEEQDEEKEHPVKEEEIDDKELSYVDGHDIAFQEEETKLLEAGTTQTYEKALVELATCDDDSRSNADISITAKPMGKWASIKLEEPRNRVPYVEVGQVPPLVRRPCYGWISEEEE